MSTMMWTYAAIALLVILAILLAAPYLGVYGTTDPFDERTSEQPPEEGERA